MKNTVPVCCCGHNINCHSQGGLGCMVQLPGTTRLCRCKSFTDVRISARRAASKATREAGPKAEIIKLLEERGIRYFRLNSFDIIGPNKQGRQRRIRGNSRGTPDLQCLIGITKGCKKNPYDGPWCLHKPHVLWIEVKKSDGKPSKEQVEFQAKCEALGETYLICRSAAELEAWLDQNI